jgi:hypothetical protein
VVLIVAVKSFVEFAPGKLFLLSLSQKEEFEAELDAEKEQRKRNRQL